MALFGLLSLFSSALAHGKPCQAEAVSFHEGAEAKNFKVTALKYVPEKPTDKTVLIIPPTGGTNYLDMNYAKSFCQEGFEVFVLDRWSGDDEKGFDLEIHDRFYSRAQKAIGLVLNNTPSKFVGILGTSVGALHTSVAIAQHPRLDAAFAIVGGLSIPEVIVTSDQKAMTDAKKERYKMYSFKNDQEYLDRLTAVMPLDPFKFPAPKGKSLGMVISPDDTTVPAKTQENLKSFWQPETVIEYSSSHFFAIIKTWLFHKKDIIEFFEKSAQKKMAEKT